MSYEYKISIIIPVYNTQKYLRKCIESVLSQSLTDIEIICVNDGSTDSSLKILEEFVASDSRIKLINQSNKGQAIARNKGIEASTGEYIAFLDSDDWLEPNFCEVMYKKAKSDNSDITMCSVTINNEQNGISSNHDCYTSLDVFPECFDNKIFSFNDFKDFFFRICVVPWNKIYKQEFIKKNKIKFQPNINFEDMIFNSLILSTAKKINLVRDCLVHYRYNSETSYSTNSGDCDYKKLDFFQVFELMEKMLKTKNTYNILEKSFKAYKKTSLNDWYNKITNKKVRFLYGIRLFFMYPDLLIVKVLEKHKVRKIISKLNTLTEKKKIVFRGASLILEEILASSKLRNRNNIIGIIDKNPDKIGKIVCGIPVYSYDLLDSEHPDVMVLAVQNIYNFNKMVSEELKQNKYEIKLDSQVFSIQGE